MRRPTRIGKSKLKQRILAMCGQPSSGSRHFDHFFRELDRRDAPGSVRRRGQRTQRLSLFRTRFRTPIHTLVRTERAWRRF